MGASGAGKSTLSSTRARRRDAAAVRRQRFRRAKESPRDGRIELLASDTGRPRLFAVGRAPTIDRTFAGHSAAERSPQARSRPAQAPRPNPSQAVATRCHRLLSRRTAVVHGFEALDRDFCVAGFAASNLMRCVDFPDWSAFERRVAAPTVVRLRRTEHPDIAIRQLREPSEYASWVLTDHLGYEARSDGRTSRHRSLADFRPLRVLAGRRSIGLRSDYARLGLVVADDGSGREVRDYLDSLNDDARVRTLFLPHSGNPARARNAAIAVVRAPYIAFLDSDDGVGAPQTRTTARHDARPKRDAIGATRGSRSSTTRATRSRSSSIVDGRCIAAKSSSEYFAIRRRCEHLPVLQPHNWCEKSADSTRRSIAGQDTDLWLRLALRSPACIVGESLARIRHHAGHRKRDVFRPYALRDYSLRKLAESATDTQRALLERERSLNALLWAVETAARGGRWRALAMVGKSLPSGWKFALWWYESVKALVRACLLPSRGRSRSGVNR